MSQKELQKIFQNEKMKNSSFISAFISEVATNLCSGSLFEYREEIVEKYEITKGWNLISKIENIPAEMPSWDKDINLYAKAYIGNLRKSRD